MKKYFNKFVILFTFYLKLGKTILELLNNIANLYKKTAQNPYSYGVITSLNTTIGIR